MRITTISMDDTRKRCIWRNIAEYELSKRTTNAALPSIPNGSESVTSP